MPYLEDVPMDKLKTYDFHLPYFKQGDDLAGCMGKDGEVPLAQALLEHALLLERSAQLIRRVASVAAEVPEMTCDAGTHMILITGPEEKLAGLVSDEVLMASPFEEDE